MANTITPFLWFNGQAEEAMSFYVSVFENSEVVDISRYTEVGPGPEGSLMVAKFRLNGQLVMALNGGPEYSFTEATSFYIECETQEEIDYFWNTLSEGGETGPCGWLKDRFGLSWQVTPTVLGELVRDEDRGKANSVMQAMLQMTRMDIAALHHAYDQG